MTEIVESRNEVDTTASNSGKALAVLGLTGLVTASGWLIYSATMIDHNLPLPLAINSERHLFTSGAAGMLNYYVDRQGDGRPLVLIHSINAAASAYEVQAIFECYRGRRPVYALDLPGFGFSERSDRYYSPKLYVAAIRDFMVNIVEEPADVIALSLSSEFAAKAALEQPQLFRSLTLISPTGLAGNGGKENGQQHQPERRNIHSTLKLFSFPLWSQAVYDLLVTRPSIRYFLNQSFHGKADEGLIAYSYLTSHQPGARFAPMHFISGKLFTPTIRRDVYKKLQLPGLVIYDQDPFTNFTELPDLMLEHPNWNAVRITPTRGLPHFEQLETTTRVLNNFWQKVES